MNRRLLVFGASPKRRTNWRFAISLLAIVGGMILWNYLNESGLIPHNKLTNVVSMRWATGEYKDCDTFNTKGEDDQPFLVCDRISGATEKVVKVRFYGQTFKEGKPETMVNYWKCRKNEKSDPAMTCERRKAGNE